MCKYLIMSFNIYVDIWTHYSYEISERIPHFFPWNFTLFVPCRPWKVVWWPSNRHVVDLVAAFSGAHHIVESQKSWITLGIKGVYHRYIHIYLFIYIYYAYIYTNHMIYTSIIIYLYIYIYNANISINLKMMGVSETGSQFSWTRTLRPWGVDPSGQNDPPSVNTCGIPAAMLFF